MSNMMLGTKLASAIKKNIREKSTTLSENGINPGLGLVLIGNDPSCRRYCESAHSAAEHSNVIPFKYELSEDASLGEALNLIHSLNSDSRINGILVLLPLPCQLDARRVINELAVNKDIDGVTSIAVGCLASDESIFQIFGEGRYDELQDQSTKVKTATFLPCTPFGVIRLLEHYNIDLRGKQAVVIGKSITVGKPLSLMLLAKGATVTVCHSGTHDLTAMTSQADIVCSATGVRHLVKGNMIRKGAVVVDVGFNVQSDGSVDGDVELESVAEKASLVTPVPGGVGPVTIAMLLDNTVRSAWTMV